METHKQPQQGSVWCSALALLTIRASPTALACLFGLLLSLVSFRALALPVETFELTDGVFCVDNGTDDDGLFNNGCGGPNYVFYADNRPSEVPEFPRRIRTALEYDISSLPPGFGHAIKSAELTLFFIVARDLTQPGSPPPASELLGFAGNGIASPADMLTENLLLSFAPSPESFVTLDVTDFIRELVQAGEDFAGFTFRIANDFSPGVFAEAFFFGELAPGANDDPTRTPKLVISVAVPEPSTLMLLGIALAGLGWMGRLKRRNQ